MLVNITGGADLTLGEVHQINEIIHDAVGDDAEIIFGAVHEPAMQGEIRVTVIATGFDRALSTGGTRRTSRRRAMPASPVALPKGSPVIPFPGTRPARVDQARQSRTDAPRGPRPTCPRQAESQDLSDMEIPTFIRRQMD